MSILVIGGSGRTGSLVINEALERGHKVTALTRKTSSIQARPGLKIIEGSPLNIPDLEAAIAASKSVPITSVIVTLASKRASDNPFAAVTSPPRLMADSVANVAVVMQTHSIRKIVIMSSLGVGDSYGNTIFLMKWLIKWTNMSAAFTDHDMLDAEIKKTDLDWVLVRPNMLKEGGKAEVTVFGEQGQGVPAFGGITRASVAGFLVDAVEKSTWDRKTPCIAN